MRNTRINSPDVERPENGQGNPTDTTSPSFGIRLQRTTGGFSHSHALGLTGSQSSPKTRQSSYRATSNDYHDNGSRNGSTVPETSREGKGGARTAWQLRNLIRPLPRRSRTACKRQHRLLRHFPAVVEWVHQNRYATNFQIRRRFASYMRSGRTAQYQLSNLVRLGYLAAVPVRSTSPNFPYVYYATGRGVSLVRDTYAQAGVAWQAAATETAKAQGVALASVLHEVLLTEFDWSVSAMLERRPDLERLFVERRYFRRDKQLRFQRQGRTHRVVPDSGFLLRVSPQTSGRLADAGGVLLLHLTELDNGTMSAARVREKLFRYSHWAESDAGQQYLDNMYRGYRGRPASAGFRLLLVAHDTFEAAKDRRRLVELMTPALDLPAVTRDRLWFTTASDLQVCQQQDELLNAAIWYRGRDARAWTLDYQTLPRHASAVRRRRFVAERLTQLPRHSLFPDPTHRQRP